MIKVVYDNNGVPAVSILTPGGYADIPWDASTDTIDWGKIEYPPRRASIKASWDNYVTLYNPDLNSSSDKYLFKVNLDFAPIIEPIPPQANWDGLYTALLGSTVYQYLVGLSLQFTAVNSALDKVIAAINYGDKYPDSQVAWDAFQSSINLLLYALGLTEQSLSSEHWTEIRGALDGNGFGELTLP